MPQWLNDLHDVPILLAIGGAFLTILMWVIKREVGAVKHEMFPNSGSSLRDAVDRIEQKMDSAEKKLDGHIEWHLTHRDKWEKK